MSDLNDFFAKKDRKKKRAAAAAKSAQLAAKQEQPASDAPSDNAQQQATAAVQPPPPPKQDDGWIEIEDIRGSQVNTGGRTVVEYKRDAEEKEVNGDNAVESEKFSGWIKSDGTEAQAEKEDANAAPLKQPEAAFPTLADAAKVRQVAPQKTSAPAKPAERQRPRLIFDKEKLRKKLQENADQ